MAKTNVYFSAAIYGARSCVKTVQLFPLVSARYIIMLPFHSTPDCREKTCKCLTI